MFSIFHSPHFWRDQKPPLGSRVNWGHPLSRELVGCWLVNEGSGLGANNLIGGKSGQLTSANMWKPSTHGISAQCANGSSVDCGDSPNFRPTDRATISAVIIPAATGEQVIASNLKYSINRNGIHLGQYNSRALCMVSNATAQNMAYSGTVPGFTVGKVAVLSGIMRRNTVQAYTLGRMNSSVTRTLTPTYLYNFYLGREGDSATNVPFTGKILAVYFHATDLASTEIAEFHSNPYQFLEAPRSVTYSFGETTTGATGTLSQTLGALTSAATGTVTVQGSTSATLGALTSSAAGTVEVKGSTSATLGALTSSAAGTVEVKGATTQTLGALTSSATGQVTVQGATTQTLGALSSVATGTVLVQGALSATLDSLSLSATSSAEISGQLAKTLDAASLSSAGKVEIAGQVSATLGSLTALAQGTVAITGNCAVTLGNASLAATGQVVVQGSLSATLGALTLNAYSVPEISGSLNCTLGDLILSAVGSTRVIIGLDFRNPLTSTSRLSMLSTKSNLTMPETESELSFAD